MDQSPEVIKLQKILAEQDEKHRNGQDEVIKIIVAIVAVLISFIATSFSKEGLSCTQVLLIKSSLLSATICLLLSVQRIYHNQTFVAHQAIKYISNTLEKCSTPAEALSHMKGLSISHGFLYKYSFHVIVATFCISISTLSLSALL